MADHVKHHVGHAQGNRHYLAFGMELVLDFIVMYFVMFTMIATLDHLYLNLNNVYMTLMMVAPMALIMLVAMRSMFPSPRLNWIIGIAAVVIFAGAFWAMRSQAAIGNVEFLRSMIPHHSGAILMCREATITDPEITALCDRIIKSQQEEIDQMEEILRRY